MHDYKVILTWEAIYDVTDIADYIEAEFGQARADRFQHTGTDEKIRIYVRCFSKDTYPISKLLYP